jgi:hypothetical protein
MDKKKRTRVTLMQLPSPSMMCFESSTYDKQTCEKAKF